MVCVVKVKASGNGQGRMVPSCGALAEEGMVIESETEEVRGARTAALELLLSDHLGDCTYEDAGIDTESDTNSTDAGLDASVDSGER